MRLNFIVVKVVWKYHVMLIFEVIDGIVLTLCMLKKTYTQTGYMTEYSLNQGALLKLPTTCALVLYQDPLLCNTMFMYDKYSYRITFESFSDLVISQCRCRLSSTNPLPEQMVTLRIIVCELFSKMLQFSFNKMRLDMSSARGGTVSFQPQ